MVDILKLTIRVRLLIACERQKGASHEARLFRAKWSARLEHTDHRIIARHRFRDDIATASRAIADSH